MQSILHTLLEDDSSDSWIDLESHLFRFKCDSNGDHMKIEFNMSLLCSPNIDFCLLFDEQFMNKLNKKYDTYDLFISSWTTCNVYDGSTNTIKINRMVNQYYKIKKEIDYYKIELRLNGENMHTDHQKLRLLNLHLEKCTDRQRTVVRVESPDLWVRRSVYDSFRKYDALKFKCESLKIINKKTHHILKISSGCELGYLDKSVLYKAIIEELSGKNEIHQFFINQLNQKISKLKVSSIQMTHFCGFNFEHLNYMKSVFIDDLCLNSPEEWTFFQRYIAFANKLKISTFKNEEGNQSLQLFDVVSKSSLRKFHFEKMTHCVSCDEVVKLKNMKHLVSLKLLGDQSSMRDCLFQLILNNQRLQVFKSDYVVEEKTIQSIHKLVSNKTNNSMCNLSIVFESSCQSKKIVDMLHYYCNLTNLNIGFFFKSETSFLYGMLMSNNRKKLTHIHCRDMEEYDQGLEYISDFNSFECIRASKSAIEEHEQNKKSTYPNYSMCDSIHKFDKGQTIAHLFAKRNNACYMNHSLLKQLEHTPCVKKQWLPSTHLSLHGNPIVKQMFKEKNECSGLGELHGDVLCNVFEYASGSIWEESLLYNFPRVNKNFYQSATFYKNRLINEIEKNNGIQLTQGNNKLKRTRGDEENIENENHKKRKVF